MRTSSSFFQLKPCGSEGGIPLSQISLQCAVLLDFFGPAGPAVSIQHRQAERREPYPSRRIGLEECIALRGFRRKNLCAPNKTT